MECNITFLLATCSIRGMSNIKLLLSGNCPVSLKEGKYITVIIFDIHSFVHIYFDPAIKQIGNHYLEYSKEQKHGQFNIRPCLGHCECRNLWTNIK